MRDLRLPLICLAKEHISIHVAAVPVLKSWFKPIDGYVFAWPRKLVTGELFTKRCKINLGLLEWTNGYCHGVK